MKLHPYALIIGIGIGFAVLVALRHPAFAIFAAVVSVILLDMGYRRNITRDED